MNGITIEKIHLDGSQRKVVVEIASMIYDTHGHSIEGKDIMYLFESQHPQEQEVLAAAEAIFAIFWGDYPDYEDED